MAPAWHVAWVEKDYDALFAAGPKFEKVFTEIAEMKPVLKTDALQEKFTENRAKFATVMKTYAEACSTQDKDKVYELMPELHDAFEMTASVLLPIHYPEFDGFVISFNLLYESHLPVNNVDGIIGTSETLVTKVNNLTPETFPEELTELKEQMIAEIAEMKVLVLQIKENCDTKKYDNVKSNADLLAKKIEKFVNDFI
ncbi:MAG: hypothetical protein DWP97_12075 [Calditrichaeota bacterium]|nr:MAG: hypothetical protein DWP97_12075 [Calditrichota bacterium]